MSKLLVTVFGATGNQGGSVINTILKHPNLASKYALRGITRDPSSEKSKALGARGVELVKADMSDVSSLKAAVTGSHAVFAVTNFWEHGDPKKEEEQGRAIATASFEAGVRHLIWSNLPNPGKVSSGKLPNIVHFTSKANVGEYIEAHKAGTKTAASYFMPGFFMSNIKSSILKGPDGVVAWNNVWDADSTQIPLFDAAEDAGKFVVGLLEAGPEAADGVSVQGVSDWSTPAKIVKAVSEASEGGVDVQARQIPRDVYKSFLPENIAEEITENMELVAGYSYYGPGTEKNQAESDRYVVQGEKLTSWKDFVAKTGPWKWD